MGEEFAASALRVALAQLSSMLGYVCRQWVVRCSEVEYAAVYGCVAERRPLPLSVLSVSVAGRTVPE